ncbi:MAG: hypothetical protein AAF990_07660 [Bacteroidota bacterium]
MSDHKRGLDNLISESIYNRELIEQFEAVLGKLNEKYVVFLLNYKVGEDWLDLEEDIEPFIFSPLHNENLNVEFMFTLPRVMARLHSYDLAFGLSAIHRKYKLLPFCSSGSSHLVYFIGRESGYVYALNPNQDMELAINYQELNDRFLLYEDLNEFLSSITLKHWEE